MIRTKHLPSPAELQRMKVLYSLIFCLWFDIVAQKDSLGLAYITSEEFENLLVNLWYTVSSFQFTTQDDLNFKETEMHKSQSTAASLGSGKDWRTLFSKQFLRHELQEYTGDLFSFVQTYINIYVSLLLPG